MVEFDQFKNESGHNYFVMTPTKWKNNTNAIGFKTKSGKYGHDKGDIYLQNTSLLMAKVFAHGDLYRIGVDEFVSILQGEDYQNREELKKELFKKNEEISSFTKEEWEKVNVSLDIAVYDKDIDTFVEDVLIHAYLGRMRTSVRGSGRNDK